MGRDVFILLMEENPAPVDMESMYLMIYTNLYARFYVFFTFQVVQELFHQQYLMHTGNDSLHRVTWPIHG